MSNIEIYTDGAYSPLRDQGGIGVVFVMDGKEVQSYSRMFKKCSNNKMELSAVIIALQTALKNNFESITIITDSQYVIGCACKGWQRKKNVKLWGKYDKIKKELDLKNINVDFQWVKGHNKNEFNCRADQLAVEASQEIDLN